MDYQMRMHKDVLSDKWIGQLNGRSITWMRPGIDCEFYTVLMPITHFINGKIHRQMSRQTDVLEGRWMDSQMYGQFDEWMRALIMPLFVSFTNFWYLKIIFFNSKIHGHMSIKTDAQTDS